MPENISPHATGPREATRTSEIYYHDTIMTHDTRSLSHKCKTYEGCVGTTYALVGLGLAISVKQRAGADWFRLASKQRWEGGRRPQWRTSTMTTLSALREQGRHDDRDPVQVLPRDLVWVMSLIHGGHGREE